MVIYYSNVSSVLRLGKVYTKEEPTPLSKRSPSNFSAIIAPNSGSPSASHDNLTHHELEGQSIQDQLCVRYNTSEAACREVQSRPPGKSFTELSLPLCPDHFQAECQNKPNSAKI